MSRDDTSIVQAVRRELLEETGYDVLSRKIEWNDLSIICEINSRIYAQESGWSRQKTLGDLFKIIGSQSMMACSSSQAVR